MLLVLLASSNMAIADTSPAPQSITNQGIGTWQIGLGIGQSKLNANQNNLNDSFSSTTSTSSYNNDGFMFRVVGRYNFDPFLGLEFGIVDLGNTIATTNNIDSKLFSTLSGFVSTTMSMHYKENIAIYAKIGAHFWSQDLNANKNLADGTNLMLGAGILFNIYGGTNRMMSIDWDHYQFDGVYLESIDAFSVNLVFNF